MGLILAFYIGFLTAIPGHNPQDAASSGFQRRVNDLSRIVGISPPPVRCSTRPLLLTTSDESGSILIDLNAADSEFSSWELDAALAREIVYRARAASALLDGSTISDPLIVLLELAYMGTVGSWVHRHRVSSISATIDLLLKREQSPVALLTLFESERSRLGASGCGIYESMVGGEYDELIIETKGQLARRHVSIERSKVSLAFCVRERVVGSQVAFDMFDRELLRLSQEETVRQPFIAEKLSRFFDLVPEAFNITVRGTELLLKGDSVVRFDEPDGHERAQRAANTLRLVLFEYARRITVFGSNTDFAGAIALAGTTMSIYGG